MTWRDAVRDELIRYQEQAEADELTLQEFYDFAEDELADQYPNNDHVRAKIRQVLQQLRDTGEITFIDGRGNYQISDTDGQATSSRDSVGDELERIRILNEVGEDLGDS